MKSSAFSSCNHNWVMSSWGEKEWWEQGRGMVPMGHASLGFLQAGEQSLWQGSHQIQAGRKLSLLKNQPELPESEFRAWLALRCLPRADSGARRSVKWQLLEAVVLDLFWITAARHAGTIAAAHPTPSAKALPPSAFRGAAHCWAPQSSHCPVHPPGIRKASQPSQNRDKISR